MHVVRIPILWCVVVGLLVGGCGESSGDPAQAQATYGASVNATEAVPAPAVAAEESLYGGRVRAIDGRIAGVGADGCHFRLDTGGNPPLLVRAARTEDGSCAWRVPPETDGFAVAVGTLRTVRDTLRLIANGVRVTPVQLKGPDS